MKECKKIFFWKYQLKADYNNNGTDNILGKLHLKHFICVLSSKKFVNKKI